MSRDIRQNYDEILKVLTVLGLIGVFYSTALTTISLLLIVIASCLGRAQMKFKEVISDRFFLPLTLVFAVVLVSGLYSQDSEGWQTAIRVKLPFLILPVAFLIAPNIKKKTAIDLHYWLVLISALVGLLVMIGIFRDIGSAVELISVGKSISTPIEHVKYSMTVAYAAVAGWILYREDDKLKKGMKRCLLFAVVFLVLLLHVMAVRTGLVIFYISIIFLAARYVLQPTYRKLGFGLLLGSILIPSIAIQVIPTLKQKIGYMQYDWSQYKKGEGRLYSDSERILSYQAGLSIFKNAPLIGVGYGDVREDVMSFYKDIADRPNLNKLPHSQYLTYLAGVGVLGFLIWLYGFYRPLICSVRSGRGTLLCSLILMIYLNYSLSFLVENSLDRSMSVAFLLLFLLPLLKGICSAIPLTAGKSKI